MQAGRPAMAGKCVCVGGPAAASRGAGLNNCSEVSEPSLPICCTEPSAHAMLCNAIIQDYDNASDFSQCALSCAALQRVHPDTFLPANCLPVGGRVEVHVGAPAMLGGVGDDLRGADAAAIQLRATQRTNAISA